MKEVRYCRRQIRRQKIKESVNNIDQFRNPKNEQMAYTGMMIYTNDESKGGKEGKIQEEDTYEC